MEEQRTTEVPQVNSNIDIPRLKSDLQLTDEILAQINALNLPETVVVPSLSAIKVDTVRDTLRIVCPNKRFNVIGIKAPSNVDEQPLGQTTVQGARNRLENAKRAKQEATSNVADDFMVVSIENGLFKEGSFNAEGVDLEASFDPNAEYDDRAVTVIEIPGHQEVVQISPTSESVRFPHNAVLAAVNADGGLVKNTVGSKLKEVGAVQDNQNPHKELTVNRQGGPLTREDQMARVIIRGLTQLVKPKSAHNVTMAL